MSGRAHVAGLSGAEARRRLARDGPNVLPAPPRPGIGGRLAAQLRSPLIGLLGVAAALALALGHALDAAVILVVVVANAVLDVWQGVRADRAAHALRELLRPRAVAERDGRRVEVEVAEIVVGDVVVLDAGDRVPADGRILEARNLELDESLVTGESLPVERADGELLAGTTVVRGLARMAVARTGAATRLGAIVAAATEARPATPLERQLGRFAALLLRAAGALCLALTATAWAYGGSLGESLLTGVALAVAAIPEGLPAVVSITLALGVRQLAQRGAIVRAPHAVETLGCTTTICADKTGTLTENRMEVARVADLSGAEIGLPVASLPPAVADLLLAAALASETSLLDDAGPETVEATDAAVLRAAVAAGARDRARREGVVVLAVEPFDSGRRYAAALVGRPGGQRTICVKGAPEELLGRVADASRAARLADAVARWGAEGMRTLLVGRAPGVAGDGAELPAVGFEPLGLVGISDPVRPGVSDDVAHARAAGVRTVMVTGDHPTTALAIARAIGIAGPRAVALTGSELDALGDAELVARLRAAPVVARVHPEQKLRIVRALRAAGEVVAMTGDGVNDVPALRAADIGVAMGRRGSDAAREAADMVLADDDYSTIVAAIERGRATYDNIVVALHFLLAANLGEVAAFALALPAGLGAPLAALQILVMNLLTDGLPAAALSADRPAAGIMSRPPRPASQGLLSAIGGGRLLSGGLAIGGCGLAAYLVGRAGGHAEGQTMAFVTLVASQLSYVFSVRSAGPAWRASRNRALLLAIAVSATSAAAIVAVPGLRSVFHVAPLSAGQLLVALALAAAPTALAEAAKARARRRGQPAPPPRSSGLP